MLPYYRPVDQAPVVGLAAPANHVARRTLRVGPLAEGLGPVGRIESDYPTRSGPCEDDPRTPAIRPTRSPATNKARQVWPSPSAATRGWCPGLRYSRGLETHAGPDQATVPARLRGCDRHTVERRGAGTADNARPAAAIPREQPRAPSQGAKRAAGPDGHAMGRSSGRDGRAPRRTARAPDPRVGRGTRTFPRNHLAGLRHTQHPGQSEGLLPGSVHPARSPARSTGSGPPRRGTACVDP